jgi:predicted aspartyl protease
LNSLLSNNEDLRSYNAAAIASALWDSADFSQAAIYYERALRENPNDFEALHGYGHFKLAHNQLAAAALLLEQAHALLMNLAGGGRNELSQRIVRDLAWTSYRLDRFDLAAEYFASLPGKEGLTAQLRAFGSTSPYRISSDVKEIAIPFLGTDPLPIITVVIGGKEHAFVIDTGSGQLVIDSRFLREVKLPNYGLDEVRFASGERARVGHTIIPEVRLGEAVIHHVPAEVMDIRRFAPQISGFIGTTFLQRFHLLFDFTGQVFRLRPKRVKPFEQFKEMQALPFLLFDSHLMLARCQINHYQTMAYITTALAGAAFTIPNSTFEQAKLIRDQNTIEGISPAGSMELMRVKAEKLSLEQLSCQEMTGLVGFFPAELEWRYGFRIGALISHAFFRSQNRWGIDFQKMRFYGG